MANASIQPRRNGCYPLFAFAAALAVAPHDDVVAQPASQQAASHTTLPLGVV